MQEERPVGSLELLECLTEDPFGTLHRGLEWTAPRKTREVLVRQYHPAWLDLGLATRHHEVLRNLVHLGHLKPYKGCHTSRDGSPQLVWPFAPGRSLAQVLRRAEVQGMPFGIDQALFLVWALSHHIRHLHQVKLTPGFLTPHRVWIGFDGWVQLLDVPVIGILEELLPSVPQVRDTMQPYLQGSASAGLDRDAFQLGALLFEMLTHQPLPSNRALATVLREARMNMPGGEPIPESIASLINRLLGGAAPFGTLEELERTMEVSLFEGDFDPSTFGLAFTMQTLFRQEISSSGSQGTIELDPVPMPKEPPIVASAPKRSRSGLWLASACLIGGAAVWFGTRAFMGTGTVAAAQVMAPAVMVQSAPPQPVPVTPAVPAPQVPGTPALPKVQPTVAPPVQTPKQQPVRLRVFVDEQGRVRQAHVIAGAAEGSERERAAFAAAMQKKLSPSQSEGQAARGWEEITVMVP